jgi:hypothetical protein
MTVTAQDLIDQARIRHWAFADVALGDGAALLFLNQRQRHLLLRFRDQLRGLVNTTVAQAGVVNGVLVGLDALGNLCTSRRSLMALRCTSTAAATPTSTPPKRRSRTTR